MQIRSTCVVLHYVSKRNVHVTRRTKVPFQNTICGQGSHVTTINPLQIIQGVFFTRSILLNNFVPSIRRSFLGSICHVTFGTSVRVTPNTCLKRSISVVINGVRSTNVSCFTISSYGLPVITIDHVVSVQRFRQVRFCSFSSFFPSYFRVSFLR